LEGEVFLLGHWKNYEELEENLSMPELIQTIKAMQKSEADKRKFFASLQGVDLEGEEENKGPSFDDVKRRALGITADRDDVLSLQGDMAASSGFGIGLGLGYEVG
jgi:hypothetical protein